MSRDEAQLDEFSLSDGRLEIDLGNEFRDGNMNAESDERADRRASNLILALLTQQVLHLDLAIGSSGEVQQVIIVVAIWTNVVWDQGSTSRVHRSSCCSVELLSAILWSGCSLTAAPGRGEEATS